MKFYTHIHGPLKMNATDFGDLLTFHLTLNHGVKELSTSMIL